MSKMWIVIKEVYRKNVMSGAFVMMVLGPILMLAVVGIITYFIGKTAMADSVGNIGVVNATAEIQQVFEADTGGNHYTFYDDEASAQKALEDDVLHGFLVMDNNAEQIQATYYREATSRDISVTNIQAMLQQYQTNHGLEAAGIKPEVLAEVQSQIVKIPSVNLTFSRDGQTVEKDGDMEKRSIRTGIAYAVCMIVYIFVLTYVSIISQEIATEKGSRIMEIILSSISAAQHFFGKMIGVGLVILTQIVIYGLMYVVGKFAMDQFNLGQYLNFIPSNIWETIQSSGSDVAFGALFALIGILIYTSLAGFLGSLVSRTEDVNKMITPLILLGVVGFYIGMFALSSANNAIVRIGSHVPFFLPFVMPFRLATDTVSGTEVLIATVISIVFMVLCLAAAATFYKSNVLVTSDKGLIKTFQRSYQVWKSERNVK